mgnify:CR=1 FL=1
MNKNLKSNIFYIALILIFKEMAYMLLALSTFNNNFFRQILAYSLSIVPVFFLIILLNKKTINVNNIISQRCNKSFLMFSFTNLKFMLYSFGLLCISNVFIYLLKIIPIFNLAPPPIEITNISIQNIFYFCLIPAILEETLYRGIIMSFLNKYNVIFSIFLSSFLFGITHSYSAQALSAFLGGIIYSYVFIKIGSLFPCIILHFLNNFFAMISVYLYSKYLTNAIDACILIFQIIFAIVTIFIYFRSKPQNILRQIKKSIPLKECIIITVSNICIDIYIIWRIGVIFNKIAKFKIITIYKKLSISLTDTSI